MPPESFNFKGWAEPGRVLYTKYIGADICRAIAPDALLLQNN